MIPALGFQHTHLDGISTARTRYIIDAILAESDHAALTTLLTTSWPTGVYMHAIPETADTDLHPWVPVLEKFHEFLDTPETNAALIKAVLDFIGQLLHYGRNKACCYFIDSIGRHLSSADTAIAEAAAFALFAYCTACPLACTHAEAESKDSLEAKKAMMQNARISEDNEVTLSAAEQALVIYESLGLLTNEYSFFDYLRGQMLVAMSSSLVVKYPGAHKDAAMLTFTIPLDASVALEDICDTASTPPKVLLSLRYVLKAIAGLQGSIEDRMDVLRLRLLCLYVVLKSRIPQDRLHAIIGKDSSVLKDLLALADKTSEAATDLLHPIPSALASLAVDTILYLVEADGYRKSDSSLLHRSTVIIEELGLSVMRTQDSAHTALPWLSILLASCSEAAKLTAATSKSGATDIADMQYIRSGLRLFVTCLLLQDHIFPNRESSQVGDASSIGPVVGFLQAAMPIVSGLCSTDNKSLALADLEFVWTIARTISCLELCTSFPAFRECNVLGVIGEILVVFAAVLATKPLENMAPPLLTLLERCLGLVSTSISCGRRGLVNPMDSGVSCLYQLYFPVISLQIILSSFANTKMLWFCLVDLLFAAINAEPAYLSQFLATDFSKALLAYLRADVSTKNSVGSKFSLYRHSDGYIMFLPLMKLTLAMVITPDGVAFVTESRIVPQMLTAITYSCYLLPQCQGIPHEIIRKVGRYLGQVIREIPALKRTVFDGARGSLLYSCYEAIRAHESSVASTADTDTSFATPRMEALQKLTNICLLIENLGSSDGRRSTSEFLRDLLKEDIVDALFKAFSCTLPQPRQLHAQLGIVQSTPLVYYGSYGAARAITSLLKLGISNAHHIIIGAVFKCIETVLNTLSTQKRILRGAVLSEGPGVDAEELLNDTLGLRKRRGRGSSKGQQSSADVLILGVLDCYPVSHEPFQALSVLLQATPELEQHSWTFLTALMELEWYSTILSQCLRIPQRLAGPSLIPNYKDSIRRIYAFYRSSLLEVCRLNAANWTPKAPCVSRGKRGYLDVFDLTEKDRVGTVREKREYIVRVISASGALIRDGIDIVTSRVVYLAPIGSVLTAFDRICTSECVRYRTALGWLSESRRDKDKVPIVELIDIRTLPADSPSASLSDTEAPEFLSLRQSAGFAMTRIHVSLKQVAIYLSRSMIAETPTSRTASRAFTLADGATIVSSSLSRIVKGLCESAFENMDEALMPASISVFRETIASTSRIERTGSSSSLSDTPLKIDKRYPKTPGSKSSGKKLSARAGDEEEEEIVTESVSVDTATICLYQGAVMKHIILPILDDNTNNVNVYLLEKFHSDLVIESIADSFAFVLSVLHDALGSDATLVSTAGRCALGVIPAFMTFFRRVSLRDSLARSSIAQHLAESKDNDFMYRFYLGLTTKLIPIYRSLFLARLPQDIQKDWLSVTGNLIVSLRAPGGPTKDSPALRAELASVNPRLRRTENSTFVPSPQLLHSLTLMGFDEVSIIEAAIALRSNNIDLVMDRITQMQMRNPNAPPRDQVVGAIDEIERVAQAVSRIGLPTPPAGGHQGIVVATDMSSSPIYSPPVPASDGPVDASIADNVTSNEPKASSYLEAASKTPGTASSNESHLKSLGDVLERRAIEYILQITSSIDKINSWREDASSDVILAPYLASFISLLKGASPSLRIETVLNDLITRVLNATTDDSSLHCVLHLLLLLIRNPEFTSEVETSFLLRVYHAIMRVLDETLVPAQEGAPASWITPALLIMQELSLAVDNSTSTTSASSPSPTADSAAAADEKAELNIVSFLPQGEAEETKLTAKELVSKKVSSAFLLSLEDRQRLLAVLRSLMRQSKGTSSVTSELCQSMFLLLTTLAADRKIAFEFVIAGGWTLVFSLRKSSAFHDASVLLSLLARRCFETSAELKLCMLAEIKGILKAAEVRLETFLEATKALQLRSPDIFVEVLSTSVDIVKKKNNVTTVKLHEDDKAHHAVAEPKHQDDQTQLTLTGLMAQVLADTDDSLLFTPADALDALSDCLLSLRGLPGVISKFNCAVAGGGFLSIPAFILRKFKIEYQVNSLQHAIVKAGFRLLCVFCSHKGACRRGVLDAIIDTLKIETSATSVELYYSPETTRCLSHLGVLISYVVKTSRTHKDGKLPPVSSQNVSVDIIEYLLSANISQLITEVLFHASPSDKHSIAMFEALIEPLEMITRPQLLNHLKKHRLKQSPEAATSEAKDNTPTDVKDDMFDNSIGVSGTTAAEYEAFSEMVSAATEFIQQAAVVADHEEEVDDDDEDEEGDDEDDDEDDDEEDEGDEEDVDVDDEEGDGDDNEEEDEDDDEDHDGDGGDEGMLQAAAQFAAEHFQPPPIDFEEDEDEEEDEEDVLIGNEDDAMFNEGNLEEFFEGLVTPRRTVVEIAAEGPVSRVEMALRDLLSPMSPSDTRDVSASIGMNIFRLLEGRRPQTAALQTDTRDLFSLRSYSNILGEVSNALRHADGNSGRPIASNRDLFGSLETALQVRSQPSRHPLLDIVDDERVRTRATLPEPPRETRRHAFQTPTDADFATPSPYAPPGADPNRYVERLRGSSFPLARQQTATELVEPLNTAMGLDTGLRLSSASESVLNGILSSAIMESLATAEVVLPPPPPVVLTVEEEAAMPSLVDSSNASHVSAEDIADDLDDAAESAPTEASPLETIPSSVETAPVTAAEESLSLADLTLNLSSSELIVERLEPQSISPPQDDDDLPDIVDSDSEEGLLMPPNLAMSGSDYEGPPPFIEHDSNDSAPVLRESDSEVLSFESTPTPAMVTEGSTAAATGEDHALPCPEGYDPDIFYSLPPELQQEILQQHDETSEQTRRLVEAAGFDMETINALPESIRQEILEQARRDLEATQAPAPTATAAAAETDNAAFLMSLPPELRAEVLLTAEPAFLNTLPPELIAQATAHREQAAARWQQREMIAAHNNFEGGDPDDEEEDMAPRQPRAQSARPARAVRQDGRVVLPTDEIENTFVSNRIISVFANSLVKIEFPISSAFYRVLMNIAKNPAQRDILLRVLTSLLHGNKSLAEAALGDSQALLTDASIGENALSPLNERPHAVFSSAQSSRMRAKSLKRIIAALKQLAASNLSVIFDFLRDRETAGGPALQISGRVSEQQPAHSLLDMIVDLFASEFCSTSADLEELVAFVDILCSPLDNIAAAKPAEEESKEGAPASGDQVQGAEGGLAVVTNATASADGAVDVPRVRLSRDSLNNICELMLNDAFTKGSFKHLMSIIGRLSKVPRNREIMIEIILEVIIQLGQQSQYRLESLLAAIEKQGSSGKPSADSDKPATRTLHFEALGESGSRQHETFQQSLSALTAIVSLNDARVSCIYSAESMGGIWDALDSVLLSLQDFLNTDKEETPNSRRPPSIIMSLLNRLLPIVDSFFLLYAHDITGEVADAETSASENATDSSAPQLVRVQSTPGATHRRTSEFRRLNITISFDVAGDPRVTNVRSRTTRTTSYIGALNSLTNIQRLFAFVQNHQGVLNLLVRFNPGLLEGSLAPLIRVTTLRSYLLFDNKRVFFFSQLHKKMASSRSRRGVHIQVRRGQIFEDSFHQLHDRSKEDMRGRLQVTFHGEEGVDAGGLTREWYLTLSREMFNPNYALFSPVDAATFQPNPLSVINTNHLDYFKFVGRIIGKAIADGHLMDAHFTRSFYKHVLGNSVDYADLEALEPEYYSSLKQILELPLDCLGLDLTFSAETQSFGKQQIVDLIPGGRNVPVTDENKMEYVQLIAQHRMTTGIRSQINAFLNGFYDIVPAELISLFTPTELELLICGLPDVDLDELKQYTEYHQYRATDPCILWFWDILKSFTREEKALFLLFVTGTSKVPLGGFANLQGMRGIQRFSIHKAYGDGGKLPTAHTCFNQLDLPVYESKEQLKEKLHLAIKEGSEGFGFA